MKKPYQRLSDAHKVSMADEWYHFNGPEHFWMKWRFEIFLSVLRDAGYISGRVFDIGCGNGIVQRQLEMNSELIVDGCDLNEFALDMTNPIRGTNYLYDIFDKHPMFQNAYEVTLLLDVIEHISEPEVFLEAVKYHLKPDGLLIINVPAHEWLYGKYDKVAGHYRRYHKKALLELLQSTGWKVESCSMWGWSMIPLGLMRKIMLRNISDEKVIAAGFRPPSKMVNWLLDKVGVVERKLPGISLGTSIVAAARVS